MKQFLRFFIIFTALWLILTTFFQTTPTTYTDDIVLLAQKEYTIGSKLDITLLNNTKTDLKLKNDCAYTPLTTEKYHNGAWEAIRTEKINKEHCQTDITLKPQEKYVFSYTDESFKLFPDNGKYRVRFDYAGKTYAKEFDIVPPGFFMGLWNTIVYVPMLNLLVWLIEVIPGHSLGLAIIALTLIIKTALLVPNQKALKNGRAMQKLQPELNAIKEQYKGDQAKIAEQTMALWKKHKVSPMGSCLPLLLQFPFLIAMYMVVQKGLSPNNIHLLYDMLKSFDFTLIEPYFLTINMKTPGPWFLAFLVGVLQFAQMKLAFPSNQTKPSADDMMAMQMYMMNKMFTYVMPVMIGFLTLTTPAGVGIYWGISTLYAIAQQRIVNRK